MMNTTSISMSRHYHGIRASSIINTDTCHKIAPKHIQNDIPPFSFFSFFQLKYSIRSIILFANIEVSRHILVVDTYLNGGIIASVILALAVAWV
jgi:hypothetical protein